MDQHRFDALARAVAGSRTRREAARLLGAAVGLLALEPAAIPAANAQADACRPGGERCKRGSQCCSGDCKKERRKNGGKTKRGKCAGLGRFAANCPRTDACNLTEFTAECSVGDVEGTCTVTPSGKAFCASTSLCRTNEVVCSTDADCVAVLQHPDAKCFPCRSNCFGNVACVVYAGDEDSN